MFLDEFTVSIIIPVYNGGESFHRCMASIARIETVPNEVIVVANGDTDNSWQVAQQFGAMVIRLPDPIGPAKARNIGSAAATGDLLFFVDADVEVEPDAIAQIISLFQGDPNLAAAIGSYDDSPGESNFLSQYRNLFHHYTHQTACEEASTFWGACGVIRRDIFQQLQGFDERYRKPCVEDIELGYRIKRAGYQIRLCKTLQVKHLKRWDAFSIIKTDFFQRALPWTELIWRDRHLLNDLNLQTSSRVSVGLIYALFVALAASVWWVNALAVGLIIGLLLGILNRSVYCFFSGKRGLWFALQTIPWHWLYFAYSGLAFGIGSIRYHLLHKQNVAKFSFPKNIN